MTAGIVSILVQGVQHDRWFKALGDVGTTLDWPHRSRR
jgi:hypothetical protein